MFRGKNVWLDVYKSVLKQKILAKLKEGRLRRKVDSFREGPPQAKIARFSSLSPSLSLSLSLYPFLLSPFLCLAPLLILLKILCDRFEQLDAP